MDVHYLYLSNATTVSYNAGELVQTKNSHFNHLGCNFRNTSGLDGRICVSFGCWRLPLLPPRPKRNPGSQNVSLGIGIGAPKTRSSSDMALNLYPGRVGSGRWRGECCYAIEFSNAIVLMQRTIHATVSWSTCSPECSRTFS